MTYIKNVIIIVFLITFAFLQAANANLTYAQQQSTTTNTTTSSGNLFSSIFGFNLPWFDTNKAKHEGEKYDTQDRNAAQFFGYALQSHLAEFGLLIMGRSQASGGGSGNLGYGSNSGAVGYLASGITYFTAQPPVNTTEYLADIGRQAGIVQPAYAQGMGEVALRPTLQLWKAFRNIAYAGFVIIFLVIGFLIMIRAKIGQQAVMTIQLALPQIIITLILVTFSYAIASLVIDLIYVGIYLIIGVFSSANLITDISKAKDTIFNSNVLKIGVDSVNPSFYNNGNNLATSAAAAVGEMVANLLGNNILEKAGLGVAGGVLAYLIFAIAILIAVFKLFFQLLTAYISIIFSVIFSPILILFNAIPGSNSFFNWLKSIIANALVFPVVAVMFLIAGVLVGNNYFGTATNAGYSFGSGSGNITLPFVGGNLSANTIQALIAIGILMMMPKVVEMVQKALGVEPGLMGAMGEAIGAPIAPFRAFGSAAIGGVVSAGASQLFQGIRQPKNQTPATPVGATPPAAAGIAGGPPVIAVKVPAAKVPPPGKPKTP